MSLQDWTVRRRWFRADRGSGAKAELGWGAGVGGARFGISGVFVESGPDTLPTVLPRRSSPQALQPLCCPATSPASPWYVAPPGRGCRGGSGAAAAPKGLTCLEGARLTPWGDKPDIR